jgi:carboxyl-terminal processing protease
MKKTTALVVFAAMYVLFLTAAFGAGYVVRAASEIPSQPAASLAARNQAYPLLGEVRGLLESRFIDRLPDDRTLEYGAVRGLVSAVGDPYTVFVEPQQHELDTHSLQGEYGGVGATLRRNEAGEIVLSPFPDSPAVQAGIVDGDVLLEVDGTAIAPHMTMDDVTVMVRGAVGSVVVLRVRHASREITTISIVRESIELPSVTWRMVDTGDAIGLIAISRFSDKTPAEVAQAIAELSHQGAASYILDLRDNGGGLLDSAVRVSGHFLPGGIVMYETQRNAPEKTYSAPIVDGPAVTAPLAVLVNHGTASAAEIVAGAMLDRGRAPLVGQPTYGKGSVQLVFDLSDGSSLHVTAYRWFTPGRRELEAGGLPPTFHVDPAENTDAQLAYAVKYLNDLAVRGHDVRVGQDQQ